MSLLGLLSDTNQGVYLRTNSCYKITLTWLLILPSKGNPQLWSVKKVYDRIHCGFMFISCLFSLQPRQLVFMIIVQVHNELQYHVSYIKVYLIDHNTNIWGNNLQHFMLLWLVWHLVYANWCDHVITFMNTPMTCPFDKTQSGDHLFSFSKTSLIFLRTQ